MFNHPVGFSATNYDALLTAWSQKNVQPGINFWAPNVHYCTAENARSSLITNHGWTFNDAGLDCPSHTVPSRSKVSGSYARISVPSVVPVTPDDLDICPANLMVHDALKQGVRSNQVKILQAHINRILTTKYAQAAGPEDGIFGILTKQGVQRLQTVLRDDLHLDLGPAGPDGVVGPFTREAINHSCGGM